VYQGLVIFFYIDPYNYEGVRELIIFSPLDLYCFRLFFTCYSVYVIFARWYIQESAVTCVMYVGKHLCTSIRLQVTNVSIVEKSVTDVPSVNELSHRCRPCSSIATHIQGRSHTAVFVERPSHSSPVLHVIKGNLICCHYSKPSTSNHTVCTWNSNFIAALDNFFCRSYGFRSAEVFGTEWLMF
jgi:hypothetical protein